MPVSLPALDEQRRLVVHSNEQTSHIDAVTGECRSLIALLKERRSALINAAVSRQIEVD